MSVKLGPKTCWLCGQALKLEDCSIDERGLSVHEQCYVAKLALHAASDSPKRPPVTIAEKRTLARRN